MNGFRRMAAIRASTKRSPGLVGGKRGEPVVQATGLRCTPLDPVDAELRNRLLLDTPHTLLQTQVSTGADIAGGDILVVESGPYAGREFPIRACEAWTWRGTTNYRLVLEDLKT